MANKEIIKVRGHHLPNIGWNIEMKELGQLLMDRKYVLDKEHLFIADSYNFLNNLKINPDQNIEIIAGEKDYICEKCPVRIEEKCLDFNPESSPLYGGVFFDKMGYKRADISLAESCGLEIGKTYTVKEIIRTTASETAKLEKKMKESYS